MKNKYKGYFPYISNIPANKNVSRKLIVLVLLRFHDLRHTFTTRLAQAGIDPYTIQRLLGHRTPSMTQRYSHHSVESLRRGIDVFERVRKEEAVAQN